MSPSLYSLLPSIIPERGLENHSLKSLCDWKTWGIRKCIKDHSSIKLFCKGVPVRSSRQWLLKFSRYCHLWDLKFLMFWACKIQWEAQLWTTILFMVPPQHNNTVNYEVWWWTHLIKNEVLPLLSSERLMILNNKLVWCDAHMECIWFCPALLKQIEVSPMNGI